MLDHTRGADVVDVQGFLNTYPFSPFQWLIFALCFAIVLLDGFDTAAIGFIAPSLVREWGVARPALAPVLSAALLGLAAGALLAGPLADTFGVCANGDANDDGRVVAFQHGCGAHSEVRLAKKHEPLPMPDHVLDTLGLDDYEVF